MLKHTMNSEITEKEIKGKKSVFGILKKNKKGLTLIQLLFIIAALIVITVMMNPLELFTKSSRGQKTVGWSNDLSNLSNSLMANKDRHNMMYAVRLRNPDKSYDLTVAAPPVSAYDPVTEIHIEGTGAGARKLSYDAESKVTYTDGSGFTAISGGNFKMTNYKNDVIESGNTQLLGLAHAGSVGIAPFINKSLPKVEENLFLGFLGAKDTEYGRQYEKDGTITGLGNLALEDMLKIAFGEGGTKTLDTATPDQWVTLTLMDTSAIRHYVEFNSRFLNQDKFRLYYVSNVVTWEEALRIAKDKATVADEEHLRELYDNMVLNIYQDSLVVMPNDKNDIVYSEKSDFKHYKFSTAD